MLKILQKTIIALVVLSGNWGKFSKGLLLFFVLFSANNVIIIIFKKKVNCDQHMVAIGEPMKAGSTFYCTKGGNSKLTSQTFFELLPSKSNMESCEKV